MTIVEGEPALVNDEALAAASWPWLREAGFTVDRSFRSCGAHDFAYYARSVAASFHSRVGINPAADRLRVITSDGSNLRINVDDGKTTVDARDPNDTYKEGHFAIQQHGPAKNSPDSMIQIRKIEVKELPPTKKPEDK